MNKKRFLIVAVGIIDIFTAMQINFTLSSNDNAGDLMLNNVEALAQGEEGWSGCHGTGTVVCNGSASYYGKWY